jgi:hypothetical protein
MGVGGLDSALSPAPAIEAIAPYLFKAGGPAAEITLHGFNFVRGSRVYVDGRLVPTNVVSRTEIKATLPAAVLAKPGRPVIRVKNPPPVASKDWGDTSNAAKITIPYPKRAAR